MNKPTLTLSADGAQPELLACPHDPRLKAIPARCRENCRKNKVCREHGCRGMDDDGRLIVADDDGDDPAGTASEPPAPTNKCRDCGAAIGKRSASGLCRKCGARQSWNNRRAAKPSRRTVSAPRRRAPKDEGRGTRVKLLEFPAAPPPAGLTRVIVIAGEDLGRARTILDAARIPHHY